MSEDDAAKRRHFEASQLRERILEHAFIADVWRSLWSQGITDVEILKSEIDAYGYDLVVSRGSIVRHVQIKASRNEGPKRASLSTRLTNKPSACVVWLDVDDDLQVNQYWYFGAGPGEPLPGLDGRRPSKRMSRNSGGDRPERRNHVDVGRNAYVAMKDLDELITRLIGTSMRKTSEAPEAS